MLLAFSMPSLRHRFATALLIVTSSQSQGLSSQFSQRTRIPFVPNSLLPLEQSHSLVTGIRGGSSALFSTTANAMTMPSSSSSSSPSSQVLVDDITDPKLEALRLSLIETNLDVYLVPSDDPHLSEYTPDAYKRRAFLTGFHGSAGTAVVTREEALVWTDSR